MYTEKGKWHYLDPAPLPLADSISMESSGLMDNLSLRGVPARKLPGVPNIFGVMET